ncbi:MAG: hypothetical protein Kow0058_19170 [Roseovarius sp.]
MTEPQAGAGAVAFLPPATRPGLRGLGRLSLDAVFWPLGRPGRLARAGATLADLGAEDHLVGLAQDLMRPRLWLGTRARLSVILAEPAAIHAARHRRILRRPGRYHRILSYDEALLAAVPNGIFFPYGTCWVPDWRTRDLTKTAMCSLIASEKRSQEGHMLRHRVAAMVRRRGYDVAVMGRGYRPFGAMAEGLAPFRYSVVIENVRERNFFTEKLIDAVLCRTVPIYWGCPNIGDFMDVSGMIPCASEAEIEAAIAGMSKADYAARLPGLMAARDQAAAYGDIFERAARAVLTDRPVPPHPRSAGAGGADDPAGFGSLGPRLQARAGLARV